MANDVNIKIGAQDNASEVFSRLKNNATQSLGQKGLAGAIALGTIGAQALTSAVSGVVGAIGDTVNKSRDFEQQMKRVQAITKASGDDFKRLEKLAKDMGATTAFSATEAGEGIQYLAMAGFKTDEIMKALPDTLLLASAGAMDLGTSADIASNILSGMRLETEDLGRVVNTLAITATSSNTDVAQLGQAFKFVAGTASTAELQFEEVSASLGILADSAFQGSTGGTALNSALIQMLKPSKDAEKVMTDLGLKFVENNGKLKSLTEITGQLEKANLTAKEQITLFGTEGSRAISALVGAGVERMTALTDSYKTNTSAAKDMAETNMDSFAGAMKELESATEAVQLALGSSLMPVLKDLLKDHINPAIQGFSSFVDKMGGIVVMASDFQLAMSALWTGVGESIDQFFSDPEWRGEMMGLFGDFVSSWWDTLVAYWTGVGQLIVDGAVLLFTPLEQAGIAVWEVIKANATEIFGETINGLKMSINGLITSVNTIGSAFGVQFDKFDITPITVDAPRSIEEHWGEVKRKWNERNEALQTNFKTNLEAVQQKAGETAKIADEMFSKTPIAVNEDLLALKKKYEGAMVTDDDSIVKQSEDAGETAGKTIAKEAGESLRKDKSLITSAFSDLKSDFEADLSKAFRKALGGDFKGALSSFGDNMIDGVLDNVADKFSKTFTDALFGDGDSGFTLGSLFGKGKDGKGGFLGGMGDSVKKWFGGGKNENSFISQISNALPELALVAVGLHVFGPPIVEGVQKAFGATLGRVTSDLFGGGNEGEFFTQGTIKFDPRAMNQDVALALLQEGFDSGQSITTGTVRDIADSLGIDFETAIGNTPIVDVGENGLHRSYIDNPNSGFRSMNEARAYLNLDPIDSGGSSTIDPLAIKERVYDRFNRAVSFNPDGTRLLNLTADEIVSVWGVINNGVNALTSFIGNGRTEQEVEDQYASWVSSQANIPSFRGGGRVPGSLGSPQLVMAHGGEQVIPASTNTMSFMGGGSRNGTVNMYFNVSLSSPDADGTRRLLEGEFGDLIIERLKRDGFDGREVVASDGIINPVTV